MNKKKKKKKQRYNETKKSFIGSLTKGAWWGIGAGGILLVLGIVVLVSLLTGNNGIISGYRPPALSFEPESISRTEAAIDEDKNEAFYQQTVRDVWYTYAGQTLLLNDENYDDRNDQGKFFKELMDVIKAGDWNAYQGFFAEGYFDHNESKEAMTPQRLYDIVVEYNSDSKGITMAGITYDVENFVVKYKILANDGSYRNDLPSDTWKPQVYQIAETDAGYRIVNIINVISGK